MVMELVLIKNAHSVTIFSILFVVQTELLMPISVNSENAEELTLPIWDLVEFLIINQHYNLATVLSISPLFVVKIMLPINLSVS